jgi:hypothetical protein
MKTPRREAAMAALGALLRGIGLGMLLGGSAGDTATATVLMVGGAAIVMVVLATMSSRPAAETSDAAGWMEFRRELRRARRHDRPLTIVRIPRPIAQDPAASAAADVRALGLKLRLTDRWWADDESVFVMLPESDRQAAVPVLDRLEAVRVGARATARVASFPEDGLTSGALIAAILGTVATEAPTPIRPQADVPAYADEEMAMGEARV